MPQHITVFWDDTARIYRVTWRRSTAEAMTAALDATTRRTAVAETAAALGADATTIAWGGVTTAQGDHLC